jgi:spore coat protein U-like protein
MKNGSDYLPYMLYSGSHGGTAWSGASLSVAGGMSQAAQVIPVYGRIPAAQPAIFGTYNDTVVATVNF